MRTADGAPVLQNGRMRVSAEPGLGVRVKTAGSSGEKADVWICGRTDNGTGFAKETTIPIKVS